MNPDRTITVSVQVLPLMPDAIPIVDRAIEVIQKSGIRHMVTPHETVMEGTLDACMATARAAHEVCLEAGANKVVTFIKIVDSTEGSYIDAKLEKYR
jgi:uncharacterized protein YqgV (UPF0045/DUF77 family)